MKNRRLVFFLGCLLFFFLGVLIDRFLLFVGEEKEITNPSDFIRIYDGNVEWNDGVKWLQVESADQLIKKDPFSTPSKQEEEVLNQLSEIYKENVESLNREEIEPIAKVKEVIKPVRHPASTSSSEEESANNYSSSGGNSSSPSGGSDSPSVTPTPSQSPSESGDGEDMEWSNDYL